MRPELDPDPAWVAELSGRTAEQAHAAVVEAAGQRRLYLQLEREHDREGRSSYIEIDAPLEIHALVRLLRPRHVVEVGVASGVSSAYILRGLEQNSTGTLHSVDLPSFPRADRRPNPSRSASWSLPPGRSSGWAVPFRLKKRWDLRPGDKAEVLPLLAEELPEIDLLVYDVPHDDDSARDEFRELDPLLGAGSVAIVDHGPSGGLCTALAGWARSSRTRPVRRRGLGLFGMRRPGPTRRSRRGRLR